MLQKSLILIKYCDSYQQEHVPWLECTYCCHHKAAGLIHGAIIIVIYFNYDLSFFFIDAIHYHRSLIPSFYSYKTLGNRKQRGPVEADV